MGKIYAGVSIVGDYPKFNWDADNADTDILALAKPSYGSTLVNGIPIMYGYEFKRKVSPSDMRIFRDYIKDNALIDYDVSQFVDYGIMHLDNMYNLRDLKVAVHPESKTGADLISLMSSYLMEYCDEAIVTDFGLIKELYQDVTFDAEKAKVALRRLGKPERMINQTIQNVEKQFDQLKKTDKLFEIKKFLPREIRIGFMDYLKFANDDERIAYENLQGVDVLVYDDLTTSGTTIGEMRRYLSAINPSNTLHSFVLLKQY